MQYINYEILNNEIRQCYRYIEGESIEKGFADEQNCLYLTDKLSDENLKINGKQYWIISPYKPKNIFINENNQNLIKWFVSDCTNEEDLDKLWDFTIHKPLDIKA